MPFAIMRKPRLMLTLCLLLPLVGSCASGPASDTFCVINEPLRPTPAQIFAMSDEDVRKALTHNRTGAKRCGWQA